MSSLAIKLRDAVMAFNTSSMTSLLISSLWVPSSRSALRHEASDARAVLGSDGRNFRAWRAFKRCWDRGRSHQGKLMEQPSLRPPTSAPGRGRLGGNPCTESRKIASASRRASDPTVPPPNAHDLSSVLNRNIQSIQDRRHKEENRASAQEPSRTPSLVLPAAWPLCTFIW